MSTDSEIQSEIEALKARFSETKALYREVCALLFFRYGITPTASKLYQYVRKGSMSAPADALNKFWEELRGKARVQIDHPDLPDALKVAAADAVQTLWGQATELARTELASLRIEVEAGSNKAFADLEAEQARSSGLEARAHELLIRLDDQAAQILARSLELESERRAHAATAALTEALQRQVGELQTLQERIRSDFSAELEKGRSAIEAANERATGAERRALLEIEQERARRIATEKQLDGVRTMLAETERQSQAKALEFVTANTRITAELDAAKASVSKITVAMETRELQLQNAQQQASQFKAEADTLRALVDKFKPSGPGKSPRTKGKGS